MFKNNLYLTVLIFLIILKINVTAAVPVAVIPFEGDTAGIREVEIKVKEILGKSAGITVVADKMMSEIMKIQENAQVMGSSYHDISKLKVAEFLVTGNFSGGKLNLKAVDVNQGTEVYNKTIDIAGDSSSSRVVTKAVKEMSDALFHGASKGSEIPSDAKPYMDLITQLAGSLSGGDAASYRYIAIYSKGAYQHPDPENPKAVESAKILLKIMRQDLLRAKLYYISMKGESFWVYLDIIAEKAGKKTKFRFGILELDDGSLGIGIYEEGK